MDNWWQTETGGPCLGTPICLNSRSGEVGKPLPGVLRNHVRGDLGPIAQPSEIDFVEALPKTRSGKIMRRLLKANELGLDPGDIITLED